jgi:hypothetical protein
MRKLLFFILILFSCQPNEGFEENLIQIDLSSAKESVDNLSDFFSSIEYVMLEDSDTNPLVQPYKIVSYDSLIFVEDQELDNLLIYNRSGDFLFALKSSGNGPKEFNQIEDYQVSENSIIIKDNILMKFIEFDFSGNFVQESKHQLLSMNFAKGNSHEIHFFNNVIQNEPYNFLTISGSDSSYSIPIKKGFEDIVFVHQSGFTLNRKTSENFLSLPFSYDVFNFGFEGELKKRIRFNLNSLGLSEEERLLFENQRQEPSQREFSLMIRSFYPVGENFFFNYTSNLQNSYLGLLDSDYSLSKIGKNPTNDLDGVPLILVPWSYHKEGLILKLPSRRIAAYISNRSPVEEIKSNLVSFVKAHRDELNSDRHVLVFLNR